MSAMRIATLSTTVLAALAVGVGAPAVTSARTSPPNHCTASFADAVEDYRQTTFEKDADGFNALLHRDVTAIFADGSTLLGKEATAGFIDSFFADEEWTQTLDVVLTEVEGCRSRLRPVRLGLHAVADDRRRPAGHRRHVHVRVGRVAGAAQPGQRRPGVVTATYARRHAAAFPSGQRLQPRSAARQPGRGRARRRRC